MAEKQDIAMNQFPVVTDLSYVYGEKSNNQNKIAVEDLAKQMGIYTKKWDSNKGDLLEINAPYSIFIIGESVIGGHIMGVFANNITVLSKARQFSETKDQEGTINIYRKVSAPAPCRSDRARSGSHRTCSYTCAGQGESYSHYY